MRQWVLQARLRKHVIEVLYDGKWNSVCHYTGKRPLKGDMQKARREVKRLSNVRPDTPIVIGFDWLGGEQNVCCHK